MAENQNPGENLQIEPLSDEDLEQVAGGNTEISPDLEEGSSSGPKCCSCDNCS